MMTELQRRIGYDDGLLCESAMARLDVIEVGLEALDEGVADTKAIVSIMTSSYSLLAETIDSVKEKLLQFLNTVLSQLNNYYLNNVKVASKYREIIKRNLPKMVESIEFETYEWPNPSDYPKQYRASAVAQKQVTSLSNELRENPATVPEAVANRVDRILAEYGRSVVGVLIDPLDIRGSVKRVVTDTVRGERTVISIDVGTVDRFLESIDNYKRDRDDLIRTRKNIVEDHRALKELYANTVGPSTTSRGNRIQDYNAPEREAFMAMEQKRFADIHTEMMRLFNGYIAIYQAAFDTKLQLLQDRVQSYRNCLTELVTRTGVLPAINTKVPNGNNAPIKYRTTLIT